MSELNVDSTMSAQDVALFNSMGNYRQHVWEQLTDMQARAVIRVDLGQKSIAQCRTAISQYASKHNKVFKTKLRNGKLYVIRIS